MKRGALLYIADYDLSAFTTYRHRGHLPLTRGTVDEVDARSANYTLGDAWRLRMHRDLMGNEPGTGICGECSLSASAAQGVVRNAICAPSLSRSGPLSVRDALFATPDIWIGVVVWERYYEAAPNRHTGWYTGSLVEMNRSIAEDAENSVTPIRPVRIITVNATRAAEFVFTRASDIGLPEISEIEVARKCPPQT